MQIKVTFNGKPYEIGKFGPADYVAFERHFGVSAGDFEDPDKTRFEYLCFLVHRGLVKQKATDLGFTDEFLEQIEELAIDTEDDEDAAPLDEAAQAG